MGAAGEHTARAAPTDRTEHQESRCLPGNCLAELEEEQVLNAEIALTSTQITSEAMLSTQPALAETLQKHLDIHYERYLEYYFMQGQPHSAAYRYARTCAFVQFLYQQEEIICKEVAEDRTKRLHLRSLHANVQALLDATDLVVSVPKSECYYRRGGKKLVASCRLASRSERL